MSAPPEFRTNTRPLHDRDARGVYQGTPSLHHRMRLMSTHKFWKLRQERYSECALECGKLNQRGPVDGPSHLALTAEVLARASFLRGAAVSSCSRKPQTTLPRRKATRYGR